MQVVKFFRSSQIQRKIFVSETWKQTDKKKKKQKNETKQNGAF